MSVNSVWIFTHGYPTRDDPYMAFLKPVVDAWVNTGITCTVVAPQSLLNAWVHRKKTRPLQWTDTTLSGHAVTVYQPHVLTLGRRKIGGITISAWMRARALRRQLEQCPEKPDVIYAHFWHCGIEAAAACEEIPVVVGNGESEIWVRDECGPKMTSRWLSKIRGVVSVSSKCLRESEAAGLMRFKPRAILLPNGYQPGEFYPASREAARKKLGLNAQDPIAIFVGQFSERKGVLRVVEAAKQVPGLKLLLIGSGNQQPISNQVVFSGRVPHQELVDYLNAADFFVLPTLAEGCCNAIVEALACGLPVISSDRSFNDDLLNETNAIRIDPTSISAIAAAMEQLAKDPALRQRLSQGALSAASQLQVEVRAQKLLSFMEDCTK